MSIAKLAIKELDGNAKATVRTPAERQKEGEQFEIETLGWKEPWITEAKALLLAHATDGISCMSLMTI